jgi:hypothetical protein
MSLSLTTSGFSKASKALEGAAALAKDPSPPAKAAAEWLAGQTMRVFSLGGHGGEWAPLSKMTLFIRAHRSQAPRKSAMPGSDTGRLKGSFLPFVDASGAAFGAGTNLDYAQAFNDGGPSKANTVLIKGYTRNAPGARDAQATAYARGKVQRLARVKVKPFFMHLKGGKMYDPRRFFPDGMGELASWGYLDKVRQIFAIDFHNRLGGTT